MRTAILLGLALLAADDDRTYVVTVRARGIS